MIPPTSPRLPHAQTHINRAQHDRGLTAQQYPSSPINSSTWNKQDDRFRYYYTWIWAWRYSREINHNAANQRCLVFPTLTLQNTFHSHIRERRKALSPVALSSDMKIIWLELMVLCMRGAFLRHIAWVPSTAVITPVTLQERKTRRRRPGGHDHLRRRKGAKLACLSSRCVSASHLNYSVPPTLRQWQAV
jgi:hypothetical protein